MRIMQQISRLSRIKTLTMMQLRQKVDMSFLSSKKKTINKIVFSVIAFVLAVVFTYALLFIMRLFLAIYATVDVISVFLGVLLILSLISCIAGLTNALFFSNDNVLLLSFPVKPNDVFISKLAVFYLYELIKNFNLIVGFFVGYGIFSGMPLWYYPLVLLVYTLIPLIPVCLGAIISIPVLVVRNLISRYAVVALIFLLSVGAAIVWAAGAFSNALPEEIVIIGRWQYIYQDLMEAANIFASSTYIFKMIVELILGHNFVNLPILIGGTAVLVVLTYWTARPVFFRLVNTVKSGNGKPAKPKKNKVVKSKFATELKKEMLYYLKNPIELVSNHMFVFLAPVIIYLLNSVYQAMPIRGSGYLMQLAFNVGMIIIIVSTGSESCAKLFSSEGNSFYITKTRPIDSAELAFARITITGILCFFSCVACSVIIAVVMPFAAKALWFIAITTLLVCMSHLLWSIDLDVLNPQQREFKTANIDVTVNQKRSIVIAMVLAIAFGLITYLLTSENYSIAFIKLIALASILFACRVYLTITRLKVYFRGIE